jgi:hypothetical protein
VKFINVNECSQEDLVCIKLATELYPSLRRKLGVVHSVFLNPCAMHALGNVPSTARFQPFGLESQVLYITVPPLNILIFNSIFSKFSKNLSGRSTSSGLLAFHAQRTTFSQ